MSRVSLCTLTDACRSSVLPIRSSNRSPLSSTLLMLSFSITLTSLTCPCTWSSLVAEAGAGACEFMSACEKKKGLVVEAWLSHVSQIYSHVNYTESLSANWRSNTLNFKWPNLTSCNCVNRKRALSAVTPFTKGLCDCHIKKQAPWLESKPAWQRV